MTECERVASTMTLSGDATAFDLGVPKEYATGLNSALTRLETQRKAALAKMRSADTPRAQAAAARQAAAAYAAAAKAHPDNVPPQVADADKAILDALRDGQKGWATVASGAAASDRGRYNSGERQVKKADRALARGLKQLQNTPQ
jgi:hypothetical protein